jgi:hypothetical protein
MESKGSSMDDALKQKLAALHARLGDGGVQELAAELLSLVGGAGDAPPPLLDTPWRPAKPVDGCGGSWRRHRGRILAVRQCHADGSRPVWNERAERWYSMRDGALVTDINGTLFFDNEAEAREMAEAAEEGAWTSDTRSAVV